jgi:hypothetical protein
MPGARCTRGLVCKCTKENAHEHTGSAEASDIPCAMVYGLYVLSPVSGLFSHRPPGLLTRGLIPASGDQDHTTSPSAVSMLVSHAAASTASRTQRP